MTAFYALYKILPGEHIYFTPCAPESQYPKPQYIVPRIPVYNKMCCF